MRVAGIFATLNPCWTKWIVVDRRNTACFSLIRHVVISNRHPALLARFTLPGNANKRKAQPPKIGPIRMYFNLDRYLSKLYVVLFIYNLENLYFFQLISRKRRFIISKKMFIIGAINILTACNNASFAFPKVNNTSIFRSYDSSIMGLSSAKLTASDDVLITGNNDRGVGWAALLSHNNKLKWSYPSNILRSSVTPLLQNIHNFTQNIKLEYTDSFEMADGTFYICGDVQDIIRNKNYGIMTHIDASGKLLSNIETGPNDLKGADLINIGACSISDNQITVIGGALQRGRSVFWIEFFNLNLTPIWTKEIDDNLIRNNNDIAIPISFMPWNSKMSIIFSNQRIISYASNDSGTLIISWSKSGSILGHIQFACRASILQNYIKSSLIYIYTRKKCTKPNPVLIKYSDEMSLMNSTNIINRALQNVDGGYILPDNSLFLYGGEGASGYGLPLIASHINIASGQHKGVKLAVPEGKGPNFTAIVVKLKGADQYLAIFPYGNMPSFSSKKAGASIANVGIAAMSLTFDK